MKYRQLWPMLPVVLFGLLVVLFWRGLSLDPRHIPSVHVGKSLPAFELPVLASSKLMMTTAQFRGRKLLLNVWASWCEACGEEQSFLMQLAEQGVLIYGLNYKDTDQQAQQWLNEWGNPYQLVGADRDGKVAIDLGVYGAPETFLIDEAGVVRYRHVGVLTETIWKQAFLPRMTGHMV